MKKSWYAVRTKQHRERLAHVQLCERGFATFLPLIEEWPPPAVGGPVGPMFPNYIFCRLRMPDDYQRVLWTPGVSKIVAFGGEPAVVPDELITFLTAEADTDGVVRPKHPSDDGLPVMVVRGPFQGLRAIVERRMPGRDRVLVLLWFLHRDTRVELPSAWVRQA